MLTYITLSLYRINRFLRIPASFRSPRRIMSSTPWIEVGCIGLMFVAFWREILCSCQSKSVNVHILFQHSFLFEKLWLPTLWYYYTHLAFIIKNLNLARVTEFDHGTNGDIKLTTCSLVQPDIVSLRTDNQSINKLCKYGKISEQTVIDIIYIFVRSVLPVAEWPCFWFRTLTWEVMWRSCFGQKLRGRVNKKTLC